MTRLSIRLVGRRAGLCALSVRTYLTCKVFDSGMMRVVLLIVIVLISCCAKREKVYLSTLRTVNTPMTKKFILMPDVDCYEDCFVDIISKSQDACCAAK